jgi:D-alanine-D-alanine ligase
MRKGLRVVILFGGRSVEHNISLDSARAVAGALQGSGVEVVPVAVTGEGRWWTGAEAESILGGGAAPEGPGGLLLVPDPGVRGLAGPAPDGTWRMLPVDVVFPLIHGGGGEDGTLQGLLELAGLPYVGSGVAASAVGMDKSLQRRVFREAGLPVVRSIELKSANPGSEAWRRILQEIGLPCFLKPSGLGSSVGVGLAKREEEIEPRFQEAAEYGAIVLAEPALDARELECAVLGNSDPRATAPGEIVPSREFYDYRAKYLEDTTKLLVPAPVEAEMAETLRALAVNAFRSLGCSGLARVDFFVERGGGSVWVNEINTLPGFTGISMYPRLWEAEGMSLAQLVERLLELAFERHAERSRFRRVLPPGMG